MSKKSVSHVNNKNLNNHRKTQYKRKPVLKKGFNSNPPESSSGPITDLHQQSCSPALVAQGIEPGKANPKPQQASQNIPQAANIANAAFKPEAPRKNRNKTSVQLIPRKMALCTTLSDIPEQIRPIRRRAIPYINVIVVRTRDAENNGCLRMVDKNMKHQTSRLDLSPVYVQEE